MNGRFSDHESDESYESLVFKTASQARGTAGVKPSIQDYTGAQDATLGQGSVSVGDHEAMPSGAVLPGVSAAYPPGVWFGREVCRLS